MRVYYLCFFFFQAEDGIRDVAVTGVQTCALPISADSSPAAFAPTGSDHRHPERGGCSAIELSIRSPRAGETKGYLSGQNPADYWSPGMERCPSHSGVSEPVRDRGNFSRDERPPHWRLVAAAPLDRQQDPSPRLVLHDCGAAPSAAVAASTPSRFALIDERFAEKPEPNPPGD